MSALPALDDPQALAAYVKGNLFVSLISDVLDGLVSIETAERDYGVVVKGKSVDEQATAALRAQR